MSGWGGFADSRYLRWFARTVVLAVVGQASAYGTVQAQGRGSDRLDAWVVTRYRGAQLFPDAEFTATSLATSGPRPRVESTIAGRRADTLVAVHFSAMWAAPALGKNARVQLAGPTGTIVPLTARIIGRRAFRAPRTPGPSTLRPDSNWRYGWAYLAVIAHDDGRPVSRYRGWLLLDLLPTSSPP
ncbi:hypothetical protein [Gemmatimonas sp.]